MATGPYKIDNVHVDSVAAATNQTFTSAFRGFGGPQAALGYEQQMDEIAKALGMDALAVRQANYMQTGDTTCTGQEVTSAVWSEECATRALHALGDRTPATPTRRVGRGLANTFQSYGRITWFHDTSRAWVGVEQDGTVVIRCGVPDIGAGQSNSLCQIAAEILGVPLGRVTIYATDSAVTPLAGTSTATRQLYMSGNAVSSAASAIRARLVRRAAGVFGVDPQQVDLGYGYAFVSEDLVEHEDAEPVAVLASENCRSMTLANLAKMCAAEGIELSHLSQFNAPFTEGLDPETGQGDIWPDFTFGAVAVEVAVDLETGQIDLLKCAACHDVGRAINPAAVRGQIAGGTHQGLGYALLEEFVLEQGVCKTPSLAEYLIPTVCDFPDTEVIVLESGTGVGPFGAKGIGEPALTPAAPAVANAVADALGVRIASLPFTPKKVLEALGTAQTTPMRRTSTNNRTMKDKKSKLRGRSAG
jgi:CO/xanthine dehydrogenase Mo-binding subunit